MFGRFGRKRGACDDAAKHSWYPECSNNVHYYNGWATNKAHKVNFPKVILPINGYSSYSWSIYKNELRSYEIAGEISDLERAMNYLDRGETAFHANIDMAIQRAIVDGTNKVEFTYFTATFYKKGTCHLKFHPDTERIIERLNIFASQRGGWLPPNYGKKRYEQMDAEEQRVVDEFQGKDAYDRVMADPGLYLTSATDLKALPM